MRGTLRLGSSCGKGIIGDHGHSEVSPGVFRSESGGQAVEVGGVDVRVPLAFEIGHDRPGEEHIDYENLVNNRKGFL